MPKKKKTQKTPKGHEIPVPSEKDFFDALEKASKPVKKAKKEESKNSDSSSGSKKRKDKK